MIKVNVKSGRSFVVGATDIKQLIEDNIETLVEQNLSKCSCSINESNSICDCDGGLSDDDFEISSILPEADGEDGENVIFKRRDDVEING